KSEFVVFLGPSGSGKSTLVNILGGLDTATEGEVFYRDQNLTKASERELTSYRRHDVGFIFQFYNLIPSLAARWSVKLVTAIADEPRSPDDARGRVQRGGRADPCPAQRRGAQQRRVGSARATATRRAVPCCAEPSAALAPETGIAVLEARE